jgi:hypothetical protein
MQKSKNEQLIKGEYYLVQEIFHFLILTFDLCQISSFNLVITLSTSSFVLCLLKEKRTVTN